MNDSHRHINEDVKKIIERHKNREPAFDGTVFEGQKRRFTIINQHDVEKYVPEQLQEEFWPVFNEMAEVIENGRAKDNKNPFNVYITINLDEPYVDEIIEIMKRNGQWDNGK